MESDSVMNEQFAGIMVHGRLSLDILSKKILWVLNWGCRKDSPFPLQVVREKNKTFYAHKKKQSAERAYYKEKQKKKKKFEATNYTVEISMAAGDEDKQGEVLAFGYTE